MRVSARALSVSYVTKPGRTKSLTVAGYKEVVAGLCRNREPIGDKVSFSLYTSRYVYVVTARYFVVIVCLFLLWEVFPW